MWTFGGYNDGGEFSIGNKLRPLIPKPIMPDSLNTTTQYYHLANLFNEQSKREFNTTSPVMVSSSRWNPTPEQLRVLEELYRRGTRTPSAEQIQQITAQLRRYGKIEGKNVFYWFQNHKARERQKRRRQSIEFVADDDDRPRDFKSSDKKVSETEGEAAGRSVRYEIEETKKKWTLSKNCTSSLTEESVKLQRVALTAPVAEEEEIILVQQQRRDSMETNNVTWHTMIQLINPKTITTTSKMKTRDIVNSLVKPYNRDEEEDGDGYKESQTLQLFPLHSSNFCELNNINNKGLEIRTVSNMKNSTSCTPDFQFFEFLPIKN